MYSSVGTDSENVVAGVEAPTAVLIAFDLEADPTLGYASIQNAVPVVRGLTVTNSSDSALDEVEIRVSCNPRFAQSALLRFDRLAPGESRRVSPLDLRPDHAYLADLSESVVAAINVVATVGGQELARVSQDIEVLAYDQWAGTRALPELLAAFSMPNNPAVDSILAKASTLLRDAHNDHSMNGYQSKSRDVVWKQISAIYSTLAAAGLHYAEPPASFGSDGQKIRTPDRILDTKLATCLDLAMLFASCFEQAGLRPVVLFKNGHAWVGVWLHETRFPDPLTDDVQAVRKRVDSGELLVFETTGIAAHHSQRPSLRIAMETGSAHLLAEDMFRYAVDIHRAREVQIKPLPSRVAMVKTSPELGEDIAPRIESTPVLPELDVATVVMDLPVDDTPEGRLTKWKSRLLDLTLRNKLLNFKTTKSTLRFAAPSLALLEDALADGKDFKVRPRPSLMEGQDPRMAQVHASRGGRTALDDMTLSALGNRELLSDVQSEELDKRLLGIFTAARTGLEEGGANTLYIALGLLRWTEDERSERRNLAPILLIPVTLQRQSVRSGFRLARHDDEAIINPTLLQFLKANFELRIPGLETLPVDERGVDVERVLQAFRLAVAEIKHWEVIEEAHLGLFSFTKYLMWKDLQDRTEQLKANRVVKHLIENPGQAFAREDDSDLVSVNLDKAFKPQDIFAPLLSDSSQMKALCAVATGRDLVLEGPPGTGKSQTITNIIAHSLGQGKSVLFVSEKMAALSVVHRRLEAIGLAPFCLELHSSKAKKSEVLQQLGLALDASGQYSTDEWEREANRLGALRQDLNGLVESLHKEYPNGLTAFKAMGTCIASVGQEPSLMPWPDALVHQRDDLEALREVARSMGTLGSSVGGIAGHPFALVGVSDWTPTWGDGLLSASRQLAQNIAQLKDSLGALEGLFGSGLAGASLPTLERIDALADLLLAAPKVPPTLARQAHDAKSRTQLALLIQHGKARAEHWAQAGAGWSANLAKLNGAELLAEWTQASNAWWLKSMLGKRAVTGKLAAFRTDRKRPTAGQVDAMLQPLVEVNERDQQLRVLEVDAKALLEDSYQGLETDWTALASHQDWALSFSEAVARLAAGDSGRLAALQATLQATVSGQRMLLVPGEPLGKALLLYRAALREMKQALQTVGDTARVTAPLAGVEPADGALERILGNLAAWQAAPSRLQAWCLWRGVRDKAIALGLQGLVVDVEAGRIELRSVVNHFEFSYRNWWVKKVIDVDPVLRSFSSAEHARKIVEFRDADAQFQKLTERFLAAKLAAKVPSAEGVAAKPTTEMGRLLRERQKQRAHMPVRQLIQAMPTLLPRLKPCLLMSPLSVSQYLDAGFAQFDLVIFDEASQIPVWDAVGVIARGKQVVVVGDPKQLPPTSFFNKAADADEAGANDEERVEDLESILDECLGAGMNKLSLKWHYRSRHESLITFSNYRYYENSLVTFPSPVTDDIAVRFKRVAGVYDRGGSRTNRAEADAIVGGIEEHYLNPRKRTQTLGVVTFNQTQQSLIDELLDARRQANPELDRAIAAQTGEKLFIKNLENVQGDERDVIFFSITYGPDIAGKITMNFGPLNGEGGHRRLNVAISRAREAVVIYSTLMPEQIDLARVRAAGVRDLKHYLEFAIRGHRTLAGQSSATGLEPDSPFEVEVIRTLRELGWTVHPQVGCSGYRIDIGVVDPRAPGRYLLGIECDGRSYHSGATARDRDRLRQYVLEGLGWNIQRVWSTDWWVHPAGEVQKLVQRLQDLVAEPLEDDEVHESTVVESAATSYDLSDAAVESPGDGMASSPESRAAPVTPPPSRATYATTRLEPGHPGGFYDPGADEMLKAQLTLVIEGEGPIAESVLFRRVARAWGLERTGARIVERLRGLAPQGAVVVADATESFYWPAGTDLAAWRVVREVGAAEDSRRNVQQVALEEIAVMAGWHLASLGSCPRVELVRLVCRSFGMARATAEAELRVIKALETMLDDGRAHEVGAVIHARSTVSLGADDQT
ncbi:DUF3320 domain-containing protein [Comamonas sp.]|uniref:DUF3320 domain-containing protein n=1 Tax=Comamonas sp. TaxID=34028 RepID=UPI003FA59AF4